MKIIKKTTALKVASNVQVPKGTLAGEVHHGDKFISTPYHSSMLADMVQSHIATDFCIIGLRVRNG